MSALPNSENLPSIPIEGVDTNISALAGDLLNKDLDPKLLKKLELIKAQLAASFPEKEQLDFEQVLAAAIGYSMTGNSAAASRLCGVPTPLISKWSKNGTWWPIVLEIVQYYKQKETQARIVGLIDKGLQRCASLLDDGEMKVVGKEIHRLPLNARDTVALIGMLHKIMPPVEAPVEEDDVDEKLINKAKELENRG